MTRACTIIAVLVFLSGQFHTELRAAIPADKLAQLKAATVFIQVSAGDGESSGSGFLVSRDGRVGFIATAAHLVHEPPFMAARIECVFNSGEAGEKQALATVVSLDLDLDLAILRLELPELPDPIQVGKYLNAERAPFAKGPRISVSGQGRGCSQTSGEFEVLEIEFISGQIHRLAINFSQRCEQRMSPIMGMLRFNSTER